MWEHGILWSITTFYNIKEHIWTMGIGYIKDDKF